MAIEVCVSFMGVRALHANPSASLSQYGGNGSSILIDDGDTPIIVNAGFGINDYGEKLIQSTQQKKQSASCIVLLSDYFWEHTLGLPFFTPIHFRSTTIDLLAPHNRNEIEPWFNRFSDQRFTPFHGVASFPSKVNVGDPNKMSRFGQWSLDSVAIDHPLAPYKSRVWRLKHDLGPTIIVSTCGQLTTKDTERLSKFSDPDLLIQSALFPANMMQENRFDGRFAFEDAINLGTCLRAKQTIISDYHPHLTDSTLHKIEAKLKSRTGKASTQVALARESSPVKLQLRPSIPKAG
jgi:hypothetical protein